MNADEVVKGLQYLSGVLRARAWHKARERKKEFATICSEAANLIESLQAQLAALQREVTALAIESIEREKTLAKLEAEVMHLWETQRWTDTEYDTPDIGQAVLLYMPDKETDNIRAGEYIGEGDYRIGNKLYRGMEIDAWLPLPAAPEKGAEK